MSGSSWLLLAPPGSPWLRLAAPGSSWLLSAPPGSSCSPSSSCLCCASLGCAGRLAARALPLSRPEHKLGKKSYTAWVFKLVWAWVCIQPTKNRAMTMPVLFGIQGASTQGWSKVPRFQGVVYSILVCFLVGNHGHVHTTIPLGSLQREGHRGAPKSTASGGLEKPRDWGWTSKFKWPLLGSHAPSCKFRRLHIISMVKPFTHHSAAPPIVTILQSPLAFKGSCKAIQRIDNNNDNNPNIKQRQPTKHGLFDGRHSRPDSQ